MTLKTKLIGIISIALAALSVGAFAYAEATLHEQTQTQSYQYIPLLSATTTSATSTNLAGGGGYAKVAGAKKVLMYFKRGGLRDANTGTSTFKVQGSPDGTTWTDFGLFMAATSSLQTGAPFVTNSFTSTIVLGTGTGNGTSTVAEALDLSKFDFYGIRCIVVETVDGEHTCAAAVEF